MPDDRRYQVLRIDPVLLVELFNNPPATRLTVDPPLPPGTQVVSVHAEWMRADIALILSHPDFAPVPFGEEFPEWRARYTRLTEATTMPDDGMQPTERAAALALEVEALVGRLSSENTTALRSRELSCAVTQIEQGLHWLQALTTRLGNEPKA